MIEILYGGCLTLIEHHLRSHYLFHWVGFYELSANWKVVDLYLDFQPILTVKVAERKEPVGVGIDVGRQLNQRPGTSSQGC